MRREQKDPEKLAALKEAVREARTRAFAGFHTDPEAKARAVVEFDQALMRVTWYERYGMVPSKRDEADARRRGLALEMKKK